MARNKLTATRVRAAGPGFYGDGDNLWLRVSKDGKAKSWIFIWKRGRRHEMGLGGANIVSLAAARAKAEEARAIIGRGGDPRTEMAERLAHVKQTTFGDVADGLIKSLEPGWKNEKHRAQWKMTLEVYANLLRAKPVGSITTVDVLKVLEPIWTTKAETATRVRGRIEKVLDRAKTLGLRHGENPARWKGHLELLLSKPQKLTRGHHKALPYAEIPAFMLELRDRDSVSARALEFTILNVSRTAESSRARWLEIDAPAALWVVPGARMKSKKGKQAPDHHVPFCARSLEILASLPRSNEFVFPGGRDGQPISNMAMAELLKGLRPPSIATVHGMRSTFRDWAGDCTTFPSEVAEGCMAHLEGTATVRAYRRANALEKRRALLAAWEAYCGSGGNG
jgi:integrase